VRLPPLVHHPGIGAGSKNVASFHCFVFLSSRLYRWRIVPSIPPPIYAFRLRVSPLSVRDLLAPHHHVSTPPGPQPVNPRTQRRCLTCVRTPRQSLPPRDESLPDPCRWEDDVPVGEMRGLRCVAALGRNAAAPCALAARHRAVRRRGSAGEEGHAVWASSGWQWASRGLHQLFIRI
jgi:hypothetical protein